MKKLALLSIITIFLFSCSKKTDAGPQQNCTYDSCSLKAPASEIQAVQTYLTSNNITATQHCSGLFYQIETPGTGTITPTVCSYVTVKYVGKLTNGSIFDQTQGAATYAQYLGNLVRGWANGIPYVKSGGKIRLYIPPTLGYGASDQVRSGVVVIPGNSILIFEIELVNVQ